MSNLLVISYYIKTSWVIIIDDNGMYISISLCTVLSVNL